MTLQELQNAAFWDQAVCLDCGTIQQAGVETPAAEPCEACGSEDCFSAKHLLQAHAFVEEASAPDEEDSQ